MARAQLANNASTTTTAAVTTTGQTTLAVTSSSGFPTVTTAGGLYYYVTLLDGAAIPEIVKVTDNSTTTWTITRAQDGTAARTFTSNAAVRLNVIKGVVDELWNEDKVVAATDKATPVDADLLALVDSAASNVLKKLTWANVKATLATVANTWSAVQTFGKSTRETKVAMAANDIDQTLGNYFTKTISTTTTLTVSNTPSTGTVSSFVLELTNGGTATITWWSGIKWAGGLAPVLTATGVDILGFYTHDGGTTWRGLLLAKDSK